MGEVRTIKISLCNEYCGWLARLWAWPGQLTFHLSKQYCGGWQSYERGRGSQYLTELTTLWLAGTVTAEVGPVEFHGVSERFQGANNTVIRWHGYGRCQRR